MAVSESLKNRLLSALRTPEARDEMVAALDAQAANVPQLEMTASVAYDAAELQDVADKVDAVIAALVAAGLMEAP